MDLIGFHYGRGVLILTNAKASTHMCTITAYLQEGTQGLSFLLSAPLPSLTSVNGSISTIPTFCSPHRLVNTIPPSSSSHSPHHAKHLVILILLAILILSILIILT